MDARKQKLGGVGNTSLEVIQSRNWKFENRLWGLRTEVGAAYIITAKFRISCMSLMGATCSSDDELMYASSCAGLGILLLPEAHCAQQTSLGGRPPSEHPLFHLGTGGACGVHIARKTKTRTAFFK